MAAKSERRMARLTGEDPSVQARFDRASAAGPLLKPVEREQPKKEKVVRITISMPESDHVILNKLRVLMTRGDGTQLNASQVVRAALRTLRQRPDAEIRKAAALVE